MQPGITIYMRRKVDGEWTPGSTELIQRTLDFSIYAYDGFMLSQDYQKLIVDK